MNFRIYNITALVAIFGFLMSCGGDDDTSDVNQNNEVPALAPPPDGESYYITEANFSQQGSSLSWSTDLVEWTRWNNSLIISTFYSDNDGILFYGSVNGPYNIYSSTDGLKSYTLLADPYPGSAFMNGIARNGETIVFIDGNGLVYTSTDNGQNWSQSINISNSYGDVFFLADQFVIFERDNGNVYFSSDGLNWNISNYLYVFDDFIEIADGYMLIDNNRQIVYRVGNSLDNVLDTAIAVRDNGSFTEFVSSANYLIIDENNIEVFGTLSDSIGNQVAVKGVTTDGGDNWTFEEINIPRDENNGSYPCMFGFARHSSSNYTAAGWSALKNNCVTYYSVDGGINWERMNDESLNVIQFQDVYFVE